jgi:hypothetical protein
MYVEERVYQVRPGCLGEYFSLYEGKGMAAQLRYIKVMLGYYASEIGDLNEVIHLWAHDSLLAGGAPARRRAANAHHETCAVLPEQAGATCRDCIVMKNRSNGQAV